MSAQTVTKWVADGGWEQARAAANITRPELVNKILNSINVLLEDLAADPSRRKLRRVPTSWSSSPPPLNASTKNISR